MELNINKEILLNKCLRKTILEEDLYYTKFEIRSRLILNNLSKISFFDSLFEEYKDSELISIKEVTKKLIKKPLELPEIQSEALARYLIEPKHVVMIEFTVYLDKSINEVKNELDKFLGITYTFAREELNEIINNTLMKTRWKKNQLLKNMNNDKINLIQWRETFQDVSPELEHMEKDIFIAIGFNKNKDMSQLCIKVLILLFIGCNRKNRRN